MAQRVSREWVPQRLNYFFSFVTKLGAKTRFTAKIPEF
jgi:hypothetical protein